MKVEEACLECFAFGGTRAIVVVAASSERERLAAASPLGSGRERAGEERARGERGGVFGLAERAGMAASKWRFLGGCENEKNEA